MPIVLIRTNADSITKVFGALASLEDEMKAGGFNLRVTNRRDDRMEWTCDGYTIALQIDESETIESDGVPVDLIIALNDRRTFTGACAEGVLALEYFLRREFEALAVEEDEEE